MAKIGEQKQKHEIGEQQTYDKYDIHRMKIKTIRIPVYTSHNKTQQCCEQYY